MKKVLFVLGNYYPTPSANGICVDKIINKLKTKNISAVVLSLQQHGDNMEGLYFYNPPFYFSKTKNKFSDKLLSFLKIFNKTLFYPFVNGGFYRKIQKQINTIYKKEGFDCIVSVSYPRDACLAAIKFKKKHKNLKVISYFLDPFTDERKHKFIPKTKAIKKCLKYEQQIIKKSSFVIAQLEHKEHFYNNYSNNILNKISFLGVPLLERKNSFNNHYFNNEILSAVFAGSLYNEIRNPSYAIELFKRTHNFIFNIYSNANEQWIKSMIDGAGNIHYHKSIPYANISDVLSQANILINIENTISNSTPSKVFEYLGYCKPIINFTKNKESLLCSIIDEFGIGINVYEVDTIDENIKKIKNYLSKTKPYDFDLIKEKYYIYTPEAFIDILMKQLYENKY